MKRDFCRLVVVGLLAAAISGGVPTVGQANPLPTFDATSATIDNQYLRFDQMPSSENFTGWENPGEVPSGEIATYYNEGTEVVKVPDWDNSQFVDVDCLKVRASDGNPLNEVTSYMAQDVLGDVYLVRILADLDDDGSIDDFLFPLDITQDLPLYMPASVSVGVIDSVSVMGYTLQREVVSTTYDDLTLITAWGEGTYDGNVQVKTTKSGSGSPEEGYEYCHPSADSDPGGIIRTTYGAAESSGYDRGDLLPTFDATSATIDNRYLRIDQMPLVQNFTAWDDLGSGPVPSDGMGTYYNEGTEIVQMPDWATSSFIPVNCNKVRVSDGDPANDITLYLAQDVSDNVYFVKLVMDLDDDGSMDEFTFPQNDDWGHVPMYMPEDVTATGVIDSVSVMGYTIQREVLDYNCCTVDLITDWGEDVYADNVKVKSSVTGSGSPEVNHEYYHPSVDSSSGGLLRTADWNETEGADRGDMLPEFDGTSATIDNQYLRFDIMASPQNFTAWEMPGPVATGGIATYTTSGTSIIKMPDWQNGTFIDVNCLVVEATDGAETVTTYLAQDVEDDVYILRIVVDLDDDGTMDDFVFPLGVDAGHLPLYMPALVDSTGVIDSISMMGYTLQRTVKEVSTGEVDLITDWGSDPYTGNVKVKTTQSASGDTEIGFEYCQPSVGLIRTTYGLAENSGHDRGEIPPTATPTPTPVPTDTPTPVPTDTPVPPTATPTPVPPTATPTPYPIPTFGADSNIIDNQYLRYDLMSMSEAFTGWGDEAGTVIAVQTLELDEIVTTPASHGSVDVHCMKGSITYNANWDFIIWLAQDVNDDVYLLKAEGIIDGTSTGEILMPDSGLSPCYPDLPLYMPSTVTVGQILPEFFGGFVRTVSSVSSGPIDLLTDWGEGSYANNLEISSPLGFEYYHPSLAPGSDTGGLIRITTASATGGYDRGALDVPDFDVDSALIDNQYLRFDLMGASAWYTGWGPSDGGNLIEYKDEGVEVVNLPAIYQNQPVSCRKLQIPYGPDWDDVYTMYLAQDTSENVYLLRITGWVGGSIVDLYLPDPLYSPGYPDLALYMPGVATAGQDLGSAFLGFSRIIVAVDCCTVDLITDWGEDIYSGNIMVSNPEGFEYYHPSAAPGLDTGGGIRVVRSDGINGYDRGLMPDTPTPTPVPTDTPVPPTDTPTPVPTVTPTPYPALPTFDDDSEVIDNPYLRFDLMAGTQIFTCWEDLGAGPVPTGSTLTYYNEGVHTLQVPDWEAMNFIEVDCLKIRISDGNPANDMSAYLAQDVLGDVYLVRIITDVDDDGTMDDFQFPIGSDVGHLPMYMPAVPTVGVMDSVTVMGYTLTRDVLSLDAEPVDLITDLGVYNSYMDNVKVLSTVTDGMDMEITYEYYHVSVGAEPAGVIRTTGDLEDDGCDRGVYVAPTDTPTPMPTATPTSTPVPAPVITYVDRDKASKPISEWVDITFDSVQDVWYDIESSPSMTAPSWTFIGSKEATGASTTFRVAGPVIQEKYYRVLVHDTALASPNYAGVIPVQVVGKTAQSLTLTMMGSSLFNTASQGIQDVVGWQMTGDMSETDADEIWRWDHPDYETAYLVDTGGAWPTYDGLWYNPDGFVPSTIDLSPGNGCWARSKRTTSQTIYMDGLVAQTEVPVDITVDAADMILHQVGQPLAADVPLTEAGTTLWDDGALGGMSENDADEIWAWDPDTGGYETAYLVDTGGAWPTYDGKWYNPDGFVPTSIVLKKGMAWWYRSKPDGAPRTGVWQWTEPIPY